MSGLFAILLLLSVLGLIFGLIKPKILPGHLTRKRYSLIFGVAIIVFFILFGITAPPSTKIAADKVKVALSSPTPQTSPAEEALENVEEETQPPKFKALSESNVLGLKTQTNSITPDNTTYCKSGDVLEHVYNPSRLQVINNCIQVSGTVDDVRTEKDGDYHINIKLDPQFKDLINDKNISGENGNLVVEIICSHNVTQTDAISSCENVTNPIKIPSIGSHVFIIGAYVLDRSHGWMEIHPAWYIGASSVNINSTSTPKTNVIPLVPLSTSNPTPATNNSSSVNGSTALCNDGTYSYAAHHQGACSHHGGVSVFYK